MSAAGPHALDPRAEVNAYRARLLDDLYDLSLQLSVFLQLGRIEDRRFFWTAGAFFTAVDRALFSNLITLATKIVGSEKAGLRKFLELAERNLELFPGLTSSDVRNDRSALESSGDRKNLKTWRNKAIAHSDKAFYFDRAKLKNLAPDPVGCLERLCQLSFRILNRYSEAFDGTVNNSVVGNAPDIWNLVQVVRRGYEAGERSLVAGQSTSFMAQEAVSSNLPLVYDRNILPAVDAHDLLAQAEGFDWDAGNRNKNLEKHDVQYWEAEEVFFHRPLVVRADAAHSVQEPRFYALGKSEAGRLLFLAFTIRGNLVRVISARDMTRREVAAYSHHEEEADP